MRKGDLVHFNNEVHIIVDTKFVLYKKSKKIIKYANVFNIKTNIRHSCPCYWLEKIEKPEKIIDKTMKTEQKKILDKTIELKNGQKMTVGKLVTHRTVPQLGLGLVVAESKVHKNYWIVQWCDSRYKDVGELGIGRDYLVIV